jgi:hypothetical protein
MIAVILYLLLCVIAGWLGKESRLGFWGVAVRPLFATPAIAILLVMVFGRRGSFA